MCIFEIQELNITSYKTDMKRLKLGKNWNYRHVALLTVKWVVMKIEFAVQLKLVAALENQWICGPVKLFILLQLQSYQQNIQILAQSSQNFCMQILSQSSQQKNYSDIISIISTKNIQIFSQSSNKFVIQIFSQSSQKM